MKSIRNSAPRRQAIGYARRVDSRRLAVATLAVLVPALACRKERRTNVSPTPTPTPAQTPTPPPPTMTPPLPTITLDSTYFDKLELTGDVVMLMDGGIHGVSGHTLRFDPSGRGRWERRVDSFDTRTRPGAGELTLDDATITRVRPLLDAAWTLARGEGGHLRRFLPPGSGPPRWVWAIAMRRGNDTVLLEGGDFPGRAPPELADLLDWLASDVDARVPPPDGGP